MSVQAEVRRSNTPALPCFPKSAALVATWRRPSAAPMPRYDPPHSTHRRLVAGMRNASVRNVCVGLAVTLSLSACGSTVQTAGQSLDDGGLGIGAAGTGQDPSDPGSLGQVPGSVTEAEGPAGQSSVNSGQADSPSGDGVNSPGTLNPTPVPSPGTSGTGFTKKEIFIGYATAKDVQAAGQAAGLGLNFGDQEAMAKSIVNDINARGGVAGRKLVLVFHDIKTVQAVQDPSTSAQAACTRWTEDKPVFAAISLVSIINNDTLFGCLAKHKTPMISSDIGMHATARFSRFAGYLYGPSVGVMDRLVPAWMKRVAASGYFTGKWNTAAGSPGTAPMKVGVIHSRHQAYGGGHFVPIVDRTLRQMGLSVTSTFEHSGDQTRMGQEMSQAVLRFRQDGVTHVVADAGVLYFMQAAESQSYRPRYALTSFSGPSFLQANVPAKQLVGALGAGWVPSTDVDNVRDPGDVSGAEARCRTVMKRAGQDTANRLAMAVMLLNCDGFNFLSSAIKKGGLSPAGIQRGAQAIGSLEPSGTFRISFPGGRQDGASVIRDLAYRQDCRCFKYTSTKNHGM